MCLFSGQPIEAHEGGEGEDEHEAAMDGDDGEEDEEEEDDEEEEEEEGEGDGDDDEEDGSDADGDDDEMSADDDDAEEEEGGGEEDNDDDSNEKKKKGGVKAAAAADANQPPEPPKFSIQEDPVAHMLIRKLLQFEAAAENKLRSAEQGKGSKKPEEDKGEEADDVDVSLWETPPSDREILTRLALPLVEALHSQNLLTVWLSANRPSLILADLVRVPSASARARELLKPMTKQIEANVSKFSGATALKEVLAKK